MIEMIEMIEMLEMIFERLARDTLRGWLRWGDRVGGILYFGGGSARAAGM